MDWTYKFKSQYDYAAAWLKNPSGFSSEWNAVVVSLGRLVGTGGFNSAEAQALDQVRAKVTRADGKIVTWDNGILAAAKVGANAPPSLPDEAKMRASVLKFLAHTYLVSASGARTVWVHAAPKAFRHWESTHFNSWAATTDQVRTLLKARDEQFDFTMRKELAVSVQQALAWCLKTVNVLAMTSNRDPDLKARGQAYVRRWFADPSTTDADVDSYAAKLSQGFKDIIATLNKGSLVLTDWLPLRGASAADEVKFLNAEAFTFRSHGEGMDVIYIEKAFFVNTPGNVIKGPANWARILVHELTHMVAGTEDVVRGQARYAWYGIGPHAGFPGSDAIRNADSWAFFCADCVGVLSADQLKVALKII